MAFWLDIAAFALKVLFIFAGLGALAAVVALVARRAGGGKPEAPRLAVRSLNERYETMRETVDAALLDKKTRKARAKTRRREAKAEAKTASEKKRVFVLSFVGDIRASAVPRLAQEIDAVLTAARPGVDEVVLRVASGGGTVTGYGLAAAQVMRLRDRNVRVTASVDQVAASGGYMMACAADRIVAAPFALLGSVGVVAQVPNLHRLLKKNDIDFEEMTAGEFKRSVSVLGEITPEGRDHFRGKLDDTHEAFKRFVHERRPNLDMAQVGTGDVWLGGEALGLGLIDALSTGDDLLFRARDEARLYEVVAEQRKSLLQQLIGGLGAAASAALEAVAARLGGAARL